MFSESIVYAKKKEQLASYYLHYPVRTTTYTKVLQLCLNRAFPFINHRWICIEIQNTQ